ncbi:carboxypeptidase-like regulatory domain-containing protein [Galbitalea sp. SE-J8]|uniref:carboxypeptidase-like regulatory domain-containing protein n=1 Tax=Galbitalea sp. SE-J8 TaxID=3054952 RepID=UPI00259C9FFB|nr:carboxypeptidase-like regulatory domain-containing protein [Galbitalea sp. SE-J8]MDM4762181.1 carboxypeptidase-like regulatory domain-containing protein [Galbitalea sp. SE-J8]
MAVALVAVVGATVVSPLSAEAAPTSAAITGRVLTNGGAVVKGATVQARRSHGAVTTTHTDSKGRFYLTGLKPGTYGLKFSDHVGLNPCETTPCKKGLSPYFTTEWLGDSATFAGSTKITIRAGDKHTGVRELFDHYARLSGPVLVNGRSATAKDGVVVTLETKAGKTIGSLFASKTFFEDVTKPGNYRIRVSSRTDAFAPFYVTDPRDGNSVFHLDGIEKITGIKIAASAS